MPLSWPLNVCICRQSSFVFFVESAENNGAFVRYCGSYHTSDSVHLRASHTFIYMCSLNLNSHPNQRQEKTHVNRQSGIEKINKMFLSLRFPLSKLMWITSYGEITTTTLVYWAIFDFFLCRDSLSSNRFNWSQLPTWSYCSLNLQWEMKIKRMSEGWILSERNFQYTIHFNQQLKHVFYGSNAKLFKGKLHMNNVKQQHIQ